MQNNKWQVADTINYGILKENAKENRRYMTEADFFSGRLRKGLAWEKNAEDNMLLVTI